VELLCEGRTSPAFDGINSRPVERAVGQLLPRGDGPLTKPAALAPGAATQRHARVFAFGFGGWSERPCGGHQEWSQSQRRGLLYHQVFAIRTRCRAQRLTATGKQRCLFVFTPTRGSWLNVIEVHFSKLTRSLLHGIRVASKTESTERLHQYFRALDQEPIMFR
jgi:hypothetical protein